MAFDSITPIKIAQAALSADPTVDLIYTVPAKSSVFVKDIDICNTGNALINAYIYLVASGDSPDTANLLIPGVPIKGKTMIQWTGTQMLNEGDSIQGKGSLSGLTINISGGEAI